MPYLVGLMSKRAQIFPSSPRINYPTFPPPSPPCPLSRAHDCTLPRPPSRLFLFFFFLLLDRRQRALAALTRSTLTLDTTRTAASTSNPGGGSGRRIRWTRCAATATREAAPARARSGPAAAKAPKGTIPPATGTPAHAIEDNDSGASVRLEQTPTHETRAIILPASTEGGLGKCVDGGKISAVSCCHRRRGY